MGGGGGGGGLSAVAEARARGWSWIGFCADSRFRGENVLSIISGESGKNAPPWGEACCVAALAVAQLLQILQLRVAKV